MLNDLFTLPTMNGDGTLGGGAGFSIDSFLRRYRDGPCRFGKPLQQIQLAGRNRIEEPASLRESKGSD